MMKKSMLRSYLFMGSFCLLVLACEQKTTAPTALATIDIDAEKKAILTAIDNESRTFYKKDHAEWRKSYVQSPKVHWVCVEPDVSLRAKGWDDLSKFVADWMKANPEPMDYDKAQFKTDSVQVTIEGNMAFVSMNASNIQPDGSVRYTVGSRTMQKENGTWKILSMTSYPNDSPTGSSANVYAHKGAAK
jgi:ketosteroid isomerase-like protein